MPLFLYPLTYDHLITPMPNSAIATHNQTLYSSPEYIFPNCEPILELQENLYRYTVTTVFLTLIMIN